MVAVTGALQVAGVHGDAKTLTSLGVQKRTPILTTSPSLLLLSYRKKSKTDRGAIHEDQDGTPFQPHSMVSGAAATAIADLGAALDAPGEADRAFFLGHPERHYLVRRARRVELRMHEIMAGAKLQKAAGLPLVLRHRAGRGRREKRLFATPPLHHPECFSDAACRIIFGQIGWGAEYDLDEVAALQSAAA